MDFRRFITWPPGDWWPWPWTHCDPRHNEPAVRPRLDRCSCKHLWSSRLTTWTLSWHWNLRCNCNRIGPESPGCDEGRCVAACKAEPEVRKVQARWQASGRCRVTRVCQFPRNSLGSAVPRSSGLAVGQVVLTVTEEKLQWGVVSSRDWGPVSAPRSSPPRNSRGGRDSSWFAERKRPFQLFRSFQDDYGTRAFSRLCILTLCTSRVDWLIIKF